MMIIVRNQYPCTQDKQKRQPDTPRLPEQNIMINKTIYSNGLGRCVVSLECGRIGRANECCSPVNVFRKATS